MSDDIIIINSYPNTIEREDILENCIKQFNKTNKDIMLVTHYPVKRETQQLVDYFIYDRSNPMLDSSVLYWYGNSKFYLQSGCGNFGSASFAVLLSIQNAISLAKHLDKKVFYYFEGDCFISDLDLQNIDLLKNDIYKKGKRGHIQTDVHGVDITHKGVCMLFFMLEVDFYYENFRMLKNCEEYKKNVEYAIGSEFYFYQGLQEKIDEIDVKDMSFYNEFFPNSSFNLSSCEADHFIDILPEKTSREPILTITNPKENLKEYKIQFLKNNNDVNEAITSVPSNGYYYNILNKEIKNIKVFYKEDDDWNLVYDKLPVLEAESKNDFEYVRITHE